MIIFFWIFLILESVYLRSYYNYGSNWGHISIIYVVIMESLKGNKYFKFRLWYQKHVRAPSWFEFLNCFIKWSWSWIYQLNQESSSHANEILRLKKGQIVCCSASIDFMQNALVLFRTWVQTPLQCSCTIHLDQSIKVEIKPGIVACAAVIPEMGKCNLK